MESLTNNKKRIAAFYLKIYVDIYVYFDKFFLKGRLVKKIEYLCIRPNARNINKEILSAFFI